MLSKLIKEHIISPRNQGVISGADGVGEVVGPACGDQVVLYLKIAEGRITRAAFTTHGCWAAVAMASWVTEMAMGRTPAEALAMDGRTLARQEAGLPEDKWPCAHLVTLALHRAVRDWQRRGDEGSGKGSG